MPTFNKKPKVERNHTKMLITPAWRQHAEMISHLVQYSQNLLLVLAPKEGGKTSFLNFYLTHDTALRKVVISPKPTVEQLLRDVVEGLGLPFLGATDTFGQIKSYFQKQSSEQQNFWLILIDDAHLLTEEQICTLLHLSKLTQNHCLRMALFAEPSLELRLFAPELSKNVQGKLFTIELQAWTLEETKAFLIRAHPPITDSAQCVKIFEKSCGLPGKVIQECGMHNHSIKRISSTMMLDKAKMILTRPMTLGILAGLFVGGMYMIVNNNLDEENLGTAPINMAQWENDHWEGQTIRPNPSNDVRFEFDSSMEALALEEDAEPDKVGRAMPLAEQLAGFDIESVSKQSQKPKNSMATKQSRTLETANSSATLAQTPEKKAQRITSKHLENPEQSLLKAPANHYTLQLLGARKEENIKQFIAAHALKENVYTFKTQLSGKDWFVVVYGDYPTKQAAIEAAHHLPRSLKQENLKPWAREFKSVQAEIRRQA